MPETAGIKYERPKHIPRKKHNDGHDQWEDGVDLIAGRVPFSGAYPYQHDGSHASQSSFSSYTFRGSKLHSLLMTPMPGASTVSGLAEKKIIC